MEALDILTKWEAGANPKNPTKVVNIFEATRDTKGVVEAYVDLVWADTAHGSTTTSNLMPKFQLEMLAEEMLFKKEDDYDGLLLWCLIVEKVIPITNVSVTNLKDKLENTKLDDFGQGIKEFNTWFADKRNAIIREVGKERYTKYKRCLFKICCTTENKEFMLAISQERRDWMMDKHKAGYSYSDVMSFALKMYNNQRSLGEWKTKEALTKKKPEKDT
eukprot:15250627-Ditylum_brightwellii.AAC.1